MITMQQLLDAALAYAAAGYEIFPVNETDKTPYTEHGMKDATTDPAQLRRWWLSFPNALVGCRVPADVIILDIDPRYGGTDTWDALILECGIVNTKRLHASGRGDGGRHYWFKRPNADKLSAKPLHEWARRHGVGRATGKNGRSWTSGIDVLHHDWRYTILPPSPHPVTGKPYEWVIEGEPTRMPQWLAELVTRKPDPPTPPLTLSVQVDDSIADWFTGSHTWADVLTGWHVVEGDGEHDGSKWRHPAATAASSASVKYGCLFVYSPNTDLEETEEGDPHGYTKFRAWAELEHGGDLSVAARRARVLRDGEPAELKLSPSAAADNTVIRAVEENDLLEQLLKWPEFWAHDHGAEEWIAWPLIPAGRQVALFAPAKTGKSLLALAVCVAVATGGPILGQRNDKGPRHVLYLDYEMTAGDLYERLETLGYGPDTDLSHLHYALLPSLPALNTDEGSRKLRDLAQLVNAELVVIDTMGRAVTGEENSSDPYRDFARTTGLLLKAAGRAVLRTDHAGKNREQGQRGSSAKNDDVDVVMRIDAAEGAWTLTRTHTRIAWVPEKTVIKNVADEDGVRLIVDAKGRAYKPGTAELVSLLRTLGVTHETTCKAAQAELRAAGERASTTRIVHALQWMKEEVPTFNTTPSAGRETPGKRESYPQAETSGKREPSNGENPSMRDTGNARETLGNADPAQRETGGVSYIETPRFPGPTMAESPSLPPDFEDPFS